MAAFFPRAYRSVGLVPRCVAGRCSSSGANPVAPQLPIVDLSPFLAKPGSEAASKRAAAARELNAACRDPGFFYLVGHGIPDGDLQRLHGQARQFFELPQEAKECIAIAGCPAGSRGYQKLGENVTLGRRDWHEAIDFYAELEAADIDLEALTRSPGAASESDLVQMRPFVLGRNQWPDRPADFRPVVEAHFTNMARLGSALMDAMTVAFGLPHGHFRPLTDRSFWVARVIGYPPLGDARGEGVGLSCGEHTDYGCWTLLAQDDTPGALEVRSADGAWTAVDPRPGTLVVNLGDMLSVWTGRRFKANPHRVRHTKSGKRRTSVAFFYEPNFDAAIEPLAIDPAVAGPPGTASLAIDNDMGNPTEALTRALNGGGLCYGEHLFEKVSNNFAPQGGETAGQS